MASKTGCEIMNSEVAGSILTSFPLKEKKKGILVCTMIVSRVQEITYLYNSQNNDESNMIW